MSYIYREQENFLLRSNQQQAESFIQKNKRENNFKQR